MTVFAGDVIYATDINNIRAGTLAKPVGKATASSSQALADNTFVVIALPTEDYDTHNFHDLVTNNSRVTPTIPGYYRFTGAVSFESMATPVTVDCYLRKSNASNIATGTRYGLGVSTLSAIQCTALIPMNGSTDYVELLCRQDSAGADNTQINLPFGVFLEWEFVRPL